jgi:hypothetical protein
VRRKKLRGEIKVEKEEARRREASGKREKEREEKRINFS